MKSKIINAMIYGIVIGFLVFCGYMCGREAYEYTTHIDNMNYLKEVEKRLELIEKFGEEPVRKELNENS